MSIDEAIEHAEEVAKTKRQTLLNLNRVEVNRENKECYKCMREHEQLAGWLKKLKEYKDLEESGNLVELNYKVGDTVYIVLDMEILKQKVKKITISSNELIKFSTEIVDFYKVDIGRTVFSSEEDAEKRFSELRIC